MNPWLEPMQGRSTALLSVSQQQLIRSMWALHIKANNVVLCRGQDDRYCRLTECKHQGTCVFTNFFSRWWMQGMWGEYVGGTGWHTLKVCQHIFVESRFSYISQLWWKDNLYIRSHKEVLSCLLRKRNFLYWTFSLGKKFKTETNGCNLEGTNSLVSRRHWYWAAALAVA